MSNDLQTVAGPSPASDTTLIDDCRQLIALEREAKATKERADEARKAAETQRHVVAERLTFEGVDRISVDGCTVFPKTQLFASPRFSGMTNSDIASVLNDHGLAALLKATVNAMSFRAAIKEMVETAREMDESLIGQNPEDALPETLRPYVHIFEETTASVRKG